MSSINDKIVLVYDECYNIKHNKTLLRELGINEDKAEDILINLSATTKQTSTVILWINILSLIILGILTIIFFDYISVIGPIFIILQFALIIYLIDDFRQNKVNKNLLNYLLATQINSAQSSYNFSANLFLKITGIKNSLHNEDLSSNSIFDKKTTLLSNNNLAIPPENTLIPVFERFSILTPIANREKKYIVSNTYAANNSSHLSPVELNEISFLNTQISIFYSKYEGNYICIIIIAFIIYLLLCFPSIYFLINELLKKEINYKVNLVLSLSILGIFFFLILYVVGINFAWKYKYFDKFLETYKEQRTKNNYKKTGVFLIFYEEYAYLIKVSNFRRENNNPISSININVNNNTNNSNLNSNVNVQENSEIRNNNNSENAPNNQVVGNNIPERNNFSTEVFNTIPYTEVLNDGNIILSFNYAQEYALKILTSVN